MTLGSEQGQFRRGGFPPPVVVDLDAGDALRRGHDPSLWLDRTGGENDSNRPQPVVQIKPRQVSGQLLVSPILAAHGGDWYDR